MAVAAAGARGFLSKMLCIPKKHPFTFGMAFSCAKTSFADWLVQKYVEKREPENFDYRRNAAFAGFGLFYLGGVQYALYVPIFSRMFPRAIKFVEKPLAEKAKDFSGQMTVAAQVFVDQCIHHPFVYFPVFYTLKEAVAGGTFSSAMEKYRTNLLEDCTALWKVWVPASILNFGFSPLYMRIPVVATTSLLWTMILSYMRGNDDHAPVLDAVFKDLNRIHFLDKRQMWKAAPDLQLSHVVLTATGTEVCNECSPNSVLPEVTERILKQGGNVVESRVALLGGEMAVIIVASCPPDALSALQRETTKFLKRRENGFREVRFRSLDVARSYVNENREITGHFRVSAFDKPGIVYNVTQFLIQKGIRVVDLICEQRQADVDGKTKTFFFMEGTVKGDSDCVDMNMIKDTFAQLQTEQKIKAELTV